MYEGCRFSQGDYIRLDLERQNKITRINDTIRIDKTFSGKVTRQTIFLIIFYFAHLIQTRILSAQFSTHIVHFAMFSCCCTVNSATIARCSFVSVLSFASECVVSDGDFSFVSDF